jgi:hypothetical protein
MNIPVILQLLIYIILPTGITVIGYLVRGVMQRIENLEKTITSKMSEEDIRQLLADKIEPISSDICDIKQTMKDLYNHLIQK